VHVESFLLRVHLEGFLRRWCFGGHVGSRIVNNVAVWILIFFIGPDIFSFEGDCVSVKEVSV
jgi:hypothetical protein